MTPLPDDVSEVETMAVRLGISIDELCRRAAIDRATWTRWKSGAVMPRLDSWRRVAAVVTEAA